MDITNSPIRLKMEPETPNFSSYARFLEYPIQTRIYEGEMRYLNPKQLYRILKRKLKRQQQGEPQPRPKFQHKTRHEHAVKRKRGPRGEFVGTAGATKAKKEIKKISKYSAAAVLYGEKEESD